MLKEKLKEIGFEIIGDIAIMEPKEEKNLEELADTIKKYHKHVNVVVKKISDVSGTFRVAQHQIIKVYDEKRSSITEKLPKEYKKLDIYETLHTEAGCRFLLNINKVYFSSKLGYERLRIMKEVKDKEKILLLFAGIGVFGIVIAKYKEVTIDAVEINPYAAEYMIKNIKLNKLKGEIRPYNMDARIFLEKANLESYDRIIMPAPKDAPDFLETVIRKVKSGTKIHYYTFASKEQIDKKEIEKELEAKYPVRVIYSRKAGSIGTNTYRYAIDLEKTNN